MIKNKNFIISGIAAVLFLILLLLVKKADVAEIGPENTKIGLSHLNKLVHKMFGEHMTLYKITEVLGLLALAFVGVFGLAGLGQLIKRKKLFEVDREILFLGGLYIVVLLIYVIFEKAIVNYRPVIMPGDEHVEASFPSSHTVLACVVIGTALMLSDRYIRVIRNRNIFELCCLTLMCAIVLGRLISGVHWFTDILGGVLISICLIFLYAGLLEKFCDGEERESILTSIQYIWKR